MVIQTLEERYHIIKYSFSGSDEERFIGESGNKKYMIARVKNKAWIVKSVEFLMGQKKNRHFTDFISCFMSGDSLHVVMKYAEGISLKEKLENEECPLRERMEIGRNILDRIMILNMPDYFLQDCLKEEGIILGRGLCVNFRYGLWGLDDYQKADFGKVQMSLYHIFHSLFSEEIRDRVLPELEQFCNTLQEKSYQEMMGVYTVYDRLCKTVDSMEPGTRGSRAWEKMNRFLPAVKKFFAAALMALAIGFLVYEVRESMQEGQETRIFESIGTLNLEEGHGSVQRRGGKDK